MSTGRLCALFLALVASAASAEKQLLWGDTHLHSSISADAYLNGNFSADPETAYRYARGEPVIHPYHRARVQIGTPLDFLVVSDHAEFLGGIRSIHRDGVDTSNMGFTDALVNSAVKLLFDFALRDGYGMDLFESMTATPADPRERARELYEGEALGIPGQDALVTGAWRELANAADANNRPGEFTALIGWEWTSTPGGANLHRVVFTDGDADSAGTYLPFSRDDSPYPEDLWRWLEETSRATGDDFVSIPHNSNISKGYMFPLETLRGAAFSEAYLALRARWEPVAEATQIKGDSETHPSLSPADAFADFERYTFYIQAYPTPYRADIGDFLRPALRRGLEIGRQRGINPYRLGMIGSTDSHTGLASAEEDNFHGKLAPDSVPDNKARGTAGEGSASGWDMSASGLAAVWSEDNTREAILEAFRRREVYATTGPRIAVRFDGGWTGPATPMGGVLPEGPTGTAPLFSASAQRDPRGADLDRLQVIKGWVDAGGISHERVYDIAGNREGSPGASELHVEWRDPDFDPSEAAFYYLRVLQVPTPRHSQYDAIALGGAETGQPAMLQERAYTSPIWYSPPAGAADQRNE